MQEVWWVSLIKAAILINLVMAAFAYNAAMADQRIPRPTK